jgi:hypothetical protein
MSVKDFKRVTGMQRYSNINVAGALTLEGREFGGILKGDCYFRGLQLKLVSELG